MTAIIRLNPSIPLYVPERDDTMEAWFVVYDREHHMSWIGPLDSTGEIWEFSNPNVRACKNESIGRTLESVTKRKKRANKAHKAPRKS